MEPSQYVASKIALAALALLTSCSKPAKVAEFQHIYGDRIKVDVTNKTLDIVGKTYVLTDCSNSQFTCFKVGSYAVAFPKKCRPQPEVDTSIEFNRSIGYEHVQFLPHRSGHSGVYGPIKGENSYLFTFDEPKITTLYFSKTDDIRNIAVAEDLGWGDLIPYQFLHVEGTHELRCSQ